MSLLKPDQRGDTSGTAEGSAKPRPLAAAPSFSEVLEVLKTNDSNDTDSSWARPTVPKYDEDKKSITFQKIDIRESNTKSGRSEIHLFGVTKAGHSILVRVLNFEHYFFYPAPEGLSEDDLDALRQYLNALIKSENSISSIYFDSQRISTEGEQLLFLKISLSDARDMTRIKDEHQYKYSHFAEEHTYETAVPYSLRYMLDNELRAMTWLKIPTGKYDRIQKAEKVSCCQIEVYVHEKDLLICDTVDNREKFAPLRILSFDIECQISSVEGRFSDARHEAVIQIGNMVSLYGQEVPFIRNIFTLGTCSPIAGAQVLSFKSEQDLLMAWQKFFLEVDPDIVIGYNITQFDIPYLLNRAQTLGLRKFAFLGRIRSLPQRLTQRLPHFLGCPGYEGRLILDIFHHIRENYPGLPGQGAYKLNAVSARFLGENKEDISYKQIPILQGGDADSRRRLAIYCLKDTYLPLLLLAKLTCFEKEVAEAKATCIPYNALRVYRPLKDIAKRCLDALDNEYIFDDMTG